MSARMPRQGDQGRRPSGKNHREPLYPCLLYTSCGVDTRFVTRENAPSGVAVITVVNGDNCILLGAGANAHMDIFKAEQCLREAEAVSYTHLLDDAFATIAFQVTDPDRNYVPREGGEPSCQSNLAAPSAAAALTAIAAAALLVCKKKKA